MQTIARPVPDQIITWEQTSEGQSHSTRFHSTWFSLQKGVIALLLSFGSWVPWLEAQIITAPPVFVDVDATALAPGNVNSITNAGSLGGFFQARGGGTTIPIAAPVDGGGTMGIRFDGGDYLQHVATVGGALLAAPAGLVGLNPTCTIEVWVLNGAVDRDEGILAWGKRGGPNGSSHAFNYGWDAAWGAVGHWGSPDMGWTSGLDGGGVYSTGVPSAGVWHHLAYTFDGTTQRVYADGVLKNSEVVSLSIHSGLPIILAGQTEADGTTVTAALRGSLTIGKVRVHDGVLSGQQIATNYVVEVAAFTNGPGAPLVSGPTHRYNFSHASGSASNLTVLLDLVGNAHGLVRGGAGSWTGTRLTLPGGSSVSAAYVALPSGLLSQNSTNKGGTGEVTIEGWVRITGSQNWSRIFDFGSSAGGAGQDYLLYGAQVGTDTHTHRLEVRNVDAVGGTGGGGILDHGNTTFGQDIHFAITWNDATGEMRVYENGTFVSRRTETARLTQLNDVNVWLGRSQYSTDMNLQGQFDEFRMYNRILSDAELRGNFLRGPDSLAVPFPEQNIAVPLGTALYHSAGLFKLESFEQSTTNTLTAVNASLEAYAFSVPVPNDAIGGFVQGYPLTSLAYQTIDPLNDVEERRFFLYPTPFQFPQPPPVVYASRSALDAAWPDGIYSYQLQRGTNDPVFGFITETVGAIDVNLSASNYSVPAPVIANFDRLQAWPRTQPLEVRWLPFTGAAQGDFVQVTVFKNHQNSGFTRMITPLAAEPGVIPANATNYAEFGPDVAATDGYATVAFFNVAWINTNQYPGCPAISGVARATTIPIHFVNPIVPSISIYASNVIEGSGSPQTVSLDVRLSLPSNTEVSVAYSTTNGSASAGQDYQAVAGNLVFTPGETNKLIQISITPDTDPEPDETFVVVLSSPVIGVLGQPQAQVTILNDDSAANNSPHLIHAIPDTNGTYGTPFSFTFAADTFSDPDAGQTLTYSASDLPPGISFTPATRTLSGTPTAVGSNAVTVTASDNGSPALSTNDAFDIVISKAPLTVSANNTNRPVGAANPALSGSLTGVVNADDITATFSTTADASSPPGEYPITPSLLDPNSRLINYIVMTNLGTLIVEGVALELDMSGGLPTFCWPSNATLLTLEFTEDLTPPIVWQPVTNNIAINGNNLCYTETNSAALMRFFRLHLP